MFDFKFYLFSFANVFAAYEGKTHYSDWCQIVGWSFHSQRWPFLLTSRPLSLFPPPPLSQLPLPIIEFIIFSLSNGPIAFFSK